MAITKAEKIEKVEELHYDVYWHWGFIWKKAGSGVLNLWKEHDFRNNERMHGQLCGRSHSIVETIMKVRDTLECWYDPNMIPIEYVKKTNEGSYKAVERNLYRTFTNGKPLLPANVDSTQVDIYRWRVKKGSDEAHHSVDAVGYDMLSIFYVIRNLDFSQMKVGEKMQFRIHAGVKGKWLHVTYRGKGKCTLKNGRQYDALELELTFPSKDADSTPLHVWLAATPDHRPLSVIIQLKRIGAIQGEIVE
ncbi:MAG: DUF3108 domain-containing protein [Bacteroidales bacterium]|nr:DUF3108 domain-containing protein [Bacteroidales bacterium]